jgi:hypothetical protein
MPERIVPLGTGPARRSGRYKLSNPASSSANASRRNTQETAAVGATRDISPCIAVSAHGQPYFLSRTEMAFCAIFD